MTNTSVSTARPWSAKYQAGHTKALELLAAFHEEMTSFCAFADIDEYVIGKVSPAFGRSVDPHLFDEALAAFIAVHDVENGSHPDIVCNSTGTTDNTVQLLDSCEDNLNLEIRHLLANAGIA